MKKIILTFFTLFHLCSYAQLAQENFEGSWSPVPAASGSATDWLVLDNGIGLASTWIQQVHVVNITPSYEETPGSHAAYLPRENVTNGLFAIDYLVTPEFVVPANGQLRFQSRLTIPGDNGGIYKIKILPSASLGAPANITNYLDMFTWASELDLNPQQTTYTEKIVPIPAMYTGTTVRIAFVMQGDNMDRWLIDQAKVVALCQNPTGLSASNITLTTAQLNWTNTAFASNWEIEIIPDGSAPTGHGLEYTGVPPYIATTTATGSPLIQDPFAIDSKYRFYVRALCADTGTSDWAGPFDFKTYGYGDTCTNPLEITSLPFTDTDNTANFADAFQGSVGYAGCTSSTFPYFNGNEVVYRYTAGFTGDIVIDLMGSQPQTVVYLYNECSSIGISCLEAASAGTSGGPVTIDGFPVTAGEDYYIIITTSNSSNVTTPYTLQIQQQNCPEPVGLPVSNITTSSASISWTNPSMGSSWELQVQQAGGELPAGPGNYTSNTSSGYQVNNLTAATHYEYYVRAICGNGTFSAWAGPYLFDTSVCASADQCLYTFVMKDIYSDGWAGQTINVSQNGILLTVLQGPPAGSNVQNIQVPLCNGLPVEVFWNQSDPDGAGGAGIGLDILNPAQQAVYSMNGTGSLGLLYSGVVDCDTVLCIPPTGLQASDITMNSVNLSWNGPATGNWEYYITESGQPAPTAATPGTQALSNPALGVALAAPATNYDVYLRMVCEDNSLTSWTGPVSFGSSVCPVEDKCDYVFTMGSFFPYGWQGGYMTIFQQGTIVAKIGQSFLTGTTQSVTVPLCDDIPYEIIWTAEGGLNYGTTNTLDVYNTFGQTVFSLPMNSGVQIGTTIYTGINDCDQPLCIPPTGLYSTNTTTTTTDLGWVGTPTGNWEYYVVEAGQPAPGAATPGIATGINPTTNVPLTIATSYEFYVRQICENNEEGFSAWGGPFAFHSEICEEEDKCLYSFEMLSQSGNNGYYNTVMVISQGGFEVEAISMGFFEGYSQTVNVALCPDSDIEIYWKDNNSLPLNASIAAGLGLKVYDPFSELVFHKDFGEGTLNTVLFTGSTSCTPPACLKPLNLTVTGEGLTSATLHWDEMGDAQQWTVWALPLGSPEPVAGEGGTVVSENPFTIEDLQPSTPYIWYVMAMCGDDGNSTLSYAGSFHTLIGNDECTTAISIGVNPGMDCTAFTLGTIDGASYSGIIGDPTVFCDGTPLGTPDIWYSFVAQSTTHIINKGETDTALYIAVFEGDCEDLNQIYCSMYTPPMAVLKELVIGQTYYILVKQTGAIDPNSSLDFTLCILTPEAPVIAVVQASTPQELVEQMLLGTDCGTVSNVSIVSGSNYGFENSVGTFNQNGTDFPLEQGLLLATGGIQDAIGPFPSSHTHLTSATWPGDADLTAILPNLTALPSSNASVIEFDFVPSSCHIGFDFVFASDIYGTQWICSSNNGFAILLTGPLSQSNPETKNIAVVPGTEIPISTLSVNSPAAINDNNCVPQNTAYFGQMNSVDPLNSPICYAGQTVVMQASAQVLQGETYHLKIVIEDKDVHSIGCHDSALFIKGRACEQIVDLGIDLTEENGTAICYGETTMINTNLDPDEFDFTWAKDSTVLTGEVSPTLTVGQAGLYQVTANYKGSDCGITGSITIEFYDELQFAITDALSICEGTTGTIAVTPTNFTAGDATYAWTRAGETLPDTTAAINAAFPGLYEVTVTLHGCSATASTTLTALAPPVADAPANVVACGSYTLPMLSSGNHYFTGMGGTGTELSAGETIFADQTLYVYAQSATTPPCTAENSFAVTITPSLQFSLGGPYLVCNDQAVTITVGGANFNTAEATYSWTIDGGVSGETGSSIVATEFGTYAVTVTVGNCPSVTQSVAVQENTLAVAVKIEDFCQGNIFMLEAISEEGSFNPDSATYAWTGPDGFTAATREFAVPAKGSYTVVVTTAEGCVGTAITDIASTSCGIQRGISPNGDGLNDSFDLENLDVSHLEIFNRYGVEVYKKNDYTSEWHGQASNNNELPTGTYYYMIQRSNGEQITGWIYVNREY